MIYFFKCKAIPVNSFKMKGFILYSFNIFRNLRRINDEVTTALEPMLIAERDRL